MNCLTQFTIMKCHLSKRLTSQPNFTDGSKERSNHKSWSLWSRTSEPWRPEPTSMNSNEVFLVLTFRGLMLTYAVSGNDIFIGDLRISWSLFLNLYPRSSSSQFSNMLAGAKKKTNKLWYVVRQLKSKKENLKHRQKNEINRVCKIIRTWQ